MRLRLGVSRLEKVSNMTTTIISGSAPILLVKDVAAYAYYYRDNVDFNYDRFWGEPPCFCILYLDGIHLMLSEVDDV